MRLAPAAASREPDTILASATFHLNELLPKSVTLDVESRCDGSVEQQILVHNVVTDAWDELDLRRLTHLDRHHTLKLANPADYVRAADKVVELRLIAKSLVGGSGSAGDVTLVGGSGGHTVPAPGMPGIGGKPPRPLFHLWIDQLRMNVEYP